MGTPPLGTSSAFSVFADVIRYSVVRYSWLLLLLVVSCHAGDSPQPVSAEYSNNEIDGETIRVTFDRPVLGEESTRRLTFSIDPPADWLYTVLAQEAEAVVLRLDRPISTLRVNGVHGRDPKSTALGVQVDNAPHAWIDLQYAPDYPVLQRVIWEDKKRSGRNLVVDEEDLLRLLFDRPVRLADGATNVEPEDFRLANETDRLDDFRSPSRFEPSGEPREIRIVLGSSPLLTIAGEPMATDDSQRPIPSAPSSLAVNGTSIFPVAKIVSTDGGWGAISTHYVDIEFDSDVPRPQPLVDTEFSTARQRIFHTVTPIFEERAVVVGGYDVQQRVALDEIVVFDPAALDRRASLELQDVRLPAPAYEHTATRLAGLDGELGTEDDLVVVIGGTSGDRQPPPRQLTVIHSRNANGSVEVKTLTDGRLAVPRRRHQSIATGPLELLVDGGESLSELESGYVGCAELFEFEITNGSVRVKNHLLFRTLPRAALSLTLLPPVDIGRTRPVRYVLAYGGLGYFSFDQNECRSEHIPPLKDKRVENLGEIFLDGPPADSFSTEEAAVLASPLLYNLDDPIESLELAYEGRPKALVRSAHAAFLLPAGDTPTRHPMVLIAGGTSRHPKGDGGPCYWEVRRIFEGDEATDAVLFHFNPLDPLQSTFEVVRHPSLAVERTRFGAIHVRGLGVIFTGGGEQVRTETPSRLLHSADIFLTANQTWRPLAIALTSARAGHVAFVPRRGVPTIYLIGGHPSDEDKTPFHPVQAIPLR